MTEAKPVPEIVYELDPTTRARLTNDLTTELRVGLTPKIEAEVLARISDPQKLDLETRKKILAAVYQTDPTDPIWTKALAALRGVEDGLTNLGKRIFDIEQALVHLGVSPQGSQGAAELVDRVGVLNERFSRIEEFLLALEKKISAPAQYAPARPPAPPGWGYPPGASAPQPLPPTPIPTFSPQPIASQPWGLPPGWTP